jgi:positive regulator of sigma E activity
VKESGKVTRIIGPGLVEIEIKASFACAKCGICHFDQAGVLSMAVKNNVEAVVCDVVEVEVPEAHVVSSSILIFIFPIFAFFIGYLIKGLILGSIFLFIYLVFLYLYDKKAKTMPRITRVLSNK